MYKMTLSKQFININCSLEPKQVGTKHVKKLLFCFRGRTGEVEALPLLKVCVFYFLLLRCHSYKCYRKQTSGTR